MKPAPQGSGRKKIAPKAIASVSSVDSGPARDEWIELAPSGIAVLPGVARPVFLLKHGGTGETLPVWIHPLDASVGLHELSHGAEGSPHRVAGLLLKHLGVETIECYFSERIGHHQYATLKFAGSNRFEARVRADEVMSFCLASKTRFFSTLEFIAQCRVLNTEIEQLQEGILTGAIKEAFPELEIGSKKTGYVM